MQVEIPDVIYAFITESLGKDASDVLVDAFLSTLDKGNRLKLYVKLATNMKGRRSMERPAGRPYLTYLKQ
ncbi:hypothetical protein [Acidianus sp.]|jgi:hypothetical protein|uniref:hypothetical protein n=1 Tax=Acidianus sp. TaxID=1872104 RepID=UPI00397C4B58